MKRIGCLNKCKKGYLSQDRKKGVALPRTCCEFQGLCTCTKSRLNMGHRDLQCLCGNHRNGRVACSISRRRKPLPRYAGEVDGWDLNDRGYQQVAVSNWIIKKEA